jgi:hypothetical protein
MNKKITALIFVFLLIFVNINFVIAGSAANSNSFAGDKILKNTSGFTFLRDFFIWILKLFGLYDPDTDDNDPPDDGGGGGNDASNPEVSSKGYDIFTNVYNDKYVRFHGILRKTGTEGTGISNVEYSWTWFEYKINGVVYKTEELMCRGDNLPRVFKYSIPVEGEGSYSPKLTPGTYPFRACTRNAARLCDDGKWIEFTVSKSDV